MELIHFTVAAIMAVVTGSAPIPGPQQCNSPQAVFKILSEQYDRTEKIDTVEVQVRARTKHHRAVYREEDGDFTWKDIEAGERRGESPEQFAIGNIEPDFAERLCRLVEVGKLEGYEFGITRGFADEYRQHIATGKKAADDKSYHGSRPELGPGHGEAVDIVSLGDDRADVLHNNDRVWAYIDRYGPKEFGVGRPYGDNDSPHVGPVDGEEYLTKHGDEQMRIARTSFSRPTLCPPVRPGPYCTPCLAGLFAKANIYVLLMRPLAYLCEL